MFGRVYLLEKFEKSKACYEMKLQGSMRAKTYHAVSRMIVISALVCVFFDCLC